MRWRKRLADLDPIWVLLAVMVIDLAVNRLTIPALRPPGEIRPPSWHRNLDQVGLFCFHLASTLAIGVLALRLWRGVTRAELYAGAARAVLAPAGLVFLVLSLATVARAPTETLSFAFETSFTLLLLLVLAAQATRRGDPFVKIGMVVMAMPLVIHFYGPFALRVLMDDEAASWSSLPDRVRDAGQSSLVLAALLSPYCFSPRPFRDAATRLAPLAVAGMVGVVGAVIMRQHFEVGVLVASRGLGVELGPAAPTSLIALYLLGLTSLTWTLVSCLTADAPARRLIGAGVGLVVVGGYAFAWPLQYLVGMVGMLAIGEGARAVTAQERAGAGHQAVRTPPIGADVWQRYVAAAVGDLGAGASAVTVSKDGNVAETHLHAQRRGVAVSVRVVRADDAIHLVEVICGDQPPDREPSWTLQARPERLLAGSTHPEPPAVSSSSIVKTGDNPFDRRFRIRDRDRLSARLLDEGLRARATALLDGWLACWPAQALRYQVYPGRAAPLDHPIPITELAFRGEDGAASPERLVALIDLLAELGERAELAGLRGAAG